MELDNLQYDYDRDYFERGIQTGKSCFENYRWIAEMTIPLCMVIIDYLGIKRGETILDYGCAKGYLVKAFRWLGRDAYGYDISNYAISNSDPEIREYVSTSYDPGKKYKYAIIKDVLEHLDRIEIENILQSINAEIIFAVIPLGDGKKFNIPQFEFDITHKTRETTTWWCDIFMICGWEILATSSRIKGIKDHWNHCEEGHVFITARRLKK